MRNLIPTKKKNLHVCEIKFPKKFHFLLKVANLDTCKNLSNICVGLTYESYFSTDPLRT